MPQRLAPRRQPQQARSRRRVARILAAAARLVQRGGVAAVNTNAIAKVARLPVGTLYQFFPNREAVLKALMEAQLADFDKALWPLLAPRADALPVATQVARIVDALAQAYLRVPALAPLLRTLRSEPQFEALSQANNARIAQVVAGLARRRVPMLSSRRAAAIGTTVVEAADAVLMAWLNSGNRSLLRELKVMLRAYGEAALREESEHE